MYRVTIAYNQDVLVPRHTVLGLRSIPSASDVNRSLLSLMNTMQPEFSILVDTTRDDS